MIGPLKWNRIVDAEGGEDSASVEHRRGDRSDARLLCLDHRLVEIDNRMHFNVR